MSQLVHWVNKFGLPPGGVVHIGAHEAQEAEIYSLNRLEPVLWFEAIPELVLRARLNISSYPNQKVISSLLWSEPNVDKEFNLASNDLGSSSIFPFHLHSAAYPSIKMNRSLKLTTTTLDLAIQDAAIVMDDFTYLVLDVQGAELEVLQGAKKNIGEFDYVMAEVSVRELYKSAPLFDDIHLWLTKNGFQLVESCINTQVGWGDALYIRASVLSGRHPWIETVDSPEMSNAATSAMWIRSILIKIGIRPYFLSRSFFRRLVNRE